MYVPITPPRGDCEAGFAAATAGESVTVESLAVVVPFSTGLGVTGGIEVLGVVGLSLSGSSIAKRLWVVVNALDGIANLVVGVCVYIKQLESADMRDEKAQTLVTNPD